MDNPMLAGRLAQAAAGGRAIEPKLSVSLVGEMAYGKAIKMAVSGV